MPTTIVTKTVTTVKAHAIAYGFAAYAAVVIAKNSAKDGVKVFKEMKAEGYFTPNK